MIKEVKLTDYIYPNRDILFVALNAPEVSNNNMHWFSRNLNFWNLLYHSDLITEPISNPLEGDEMIFGSWTNNYNQMIYGVTDLVRNIVQTNSSSIKTNNKHVTRILSLIDKNSTKKLCLMHSKVAEQFQKSGIINRNYLLGKNNYGLVGKYRETEIYEVPFHNAMINGGTKLNAYAQLIGKGKLNKVKLPIKKEAKLVTAKTIPSAKSKSVFYLPDLGNSITQTDIDNGILRITTKVSINFRGVNEKVNVEIGGRNFIATYTPRRGRSHCCRKHPRMLLPK
jgi:hypothetical protein